MTNPLASSSNLTIRLLTTLSHERKQLQQESSLTQDALEEAVDVRNAALQAQADEIALLKARLEQKESELQGVRSSFQAQLQFAQEQQATIAELRAKNSRLTQSDLTLKEALALLRAVEEMKEKELPKEIAALTNDTYEHYPFALVQKILPLRIQQHTNDFNGGRCEPVISFLKNSLANDQRQT